MNKLTSLIARPWQGLKSHPVELLVLLHATVSTMLKGSPWWQLPAYWAAFAVVAALSLSFHRSKRWVAVAYWAVLPLYALTALLPTAWHSTSEYWLLTALLPAVYLLARGRSDFNARFFSLIRSTVVAVGVGLVSFILLEIINYTVCDLFGTKGYTTYTTEEYLATFCYVLLTPMVFIGMESSHDEINASKLETALVNWLLTPALLIYNIILYVYLAFIVISWDLPKGSVATMVSLFVGTAVAVRWLRPVLKKQPLEGYFRWFGLLALPLVVLFWVAAGYRIGQYGLTIDRCLLVATGALMTAFAFLSLFKTTRGSYWLLTAYTVAGLVLAVGGPLSARQLSLRSQTAVIEQYAEKLGILADDGTLALPSRNEADTVYRREHRAVYQAMNYIENDLADTVSVQQRFGVSKAEYLNHLSRNTTVYATAWRAERYGYPEESEIEPVAKRIWVNPVESVEISDIGGYSRLYSHISVTDGKIRLGDTVIEADSVLAVQLAKIGYTLESNLDQQKVEKNEAELCTYRSPDGRILMVFEFFHIECDSVSNHMPSGEIVCALIKD